MLNYFGFSQFARPISAHLAGILPLQYWFEIKLEECWIILDSRSFLSQCLHSLQGFCHCNIDPELHWKNIEFFWTVAAVLPNFYVPGKNYAIVILFRNLIGRMLNSFGRSQLSFPISAHLARILPLQCWPGFELEECWIIFDYFNLPRPISAQPAGILPLQYWCEIKLEECWIILDSLSLPAQFPRTSQGFCHCYIDSKLSWRNAELFWILAAFSHNICTPCKDSAIAILTRNYIGRILNCFGRLQLSFPISTSLARIMPL